jgi:hypothetical protein
MADINPGPQDIQISGDDTIVNPSPGVDTWYRSRDTRSTQLLEFFSSADLDLENIPKYHMRAYRALTPGFVYWDVLDEPDLTGSESGYDPSELTDIIVNAKITAPDYAPILMGENSSVSGITTPKGLGGHVYYPPLGTILKLQVVLSVSVGGLVGTVKLYNQTDNEFVTSGTLTTTNTSPTTLEATLIVGTDPGEFKPTTRTYEIWIENSGSGAGDITYLGSANLLTETGIGVIQSGHTIDNYYVPNRMPTDANTYLYWDFQETAAPFADQGSAGIPMQDVTGSGVGYQAGIRGPVFGGRGLALDSDSQNAAIRADGTAAWPASQINVAVWVTVTDYTQYNGYGKIFFKSWFPTSWSSPFAAVMFQFYTPPSDYASSYDPGGSGSPTGYEVQYDLRIHLHTPHLLGFSHDGTTLRHYVDGIEVLDQLVGTTPASNLGTGPWCIGNLPSGGSPPLGGVGNVEKIGGIYEEVRICTVARDADWWLENWQRGMGLRG